MAFSKAKLLRFNELSSCAPPPGAYNPKFDEHVPGVKYVKDKEPQSPMSSSSDVRSIHSGFSIASFRTPTVPRRKNIALPNSTGKKPIVFSPQKSEALREKIVECINKDDTIKDLETQLEELKLAISKLIVQKNDLTFERDRFAGKIQTLQNELEAINKQLTQKDLENMKIVNDCDKLKADLKAEKQAEMKQLQANLDLLQERLNEYKEDITKTEKELEDTKVTYSNLKKDFEDLNEEYTALIIKHKESLEFQVVLKNMHTTEKEELKQLREKEVNELELEMLKVISNYKETLEKIEKDNENKILDMEKEKNNELEVFKADFISEKEELLKNINHFKSDLEKINKELSETQTNLILEKDLHEKDKTALEEKHYYEITLNKTYETVNALKNRLMHSDRDVEQLSKENEALEEAIHETEQKYIEENEKLKKMNEELQRDNKALLNIQGTVVDLETQLLDKIDGFKSKADSEISRLTLIIDKKSTELQKLHNFIQGQQDLHNNAYSLINNAKEEIEKLEFEASAYKLRISNMEIELHEKDNTDEIVEQKDRQIKELKDKLKERDLEMNELASIYKKYIEKSRAFDKLQQSYEELGQKYAQLEHRIAEQDLLIGPFREQLENYERECQVLMLHKGEAEKEAKEMGLKYAQMLGHQNYKQKVKHIVDLKMKNIELMECKQNYEAKMMQQNRTIEKLKQKVSQGNKPKNIEKHIDKENVGSPVRVINSPLALKERN